MVNSEDKLDQHQNWGQNSESEINDVNVIKSSTARTIADVIETPQDKGGGESAPATRGQIEDVEAAGYLENDGTSYFYYYYPPQEQFGYPEEAPVIPEDSTYCDMVAYPYSYEAAACQGEEVTGEEEQLPMEDLQEVDASAGALPLPHNDLFINPAFSYLQFLSDGSVVGPMGEIYSPANYFPAHAAATAPVVDVSPPQTSGNPDEMAPTGLLMQADYEGKRTLIICMLFLPTTFQAINNNIHLEYYSELVVFCCAGLYLYYAQSRFA